MAQRLLSISLGTLTAKLAEVEKSGRKVTIYSAYDVNLSEGLCDDGIILDAESLAAELKQYIKKYNIKAKKLVFSIASKRIASKEVIIPFVKEKQIQGIININAPEYFPVSNIEEYSINYSVIETVKSEENTQYRMNVTATPNDILEGYNALANEMKYPIEDMDYAGNAILQVLSFQNEADEVNAILQLGTESTVINLMNGKTQIMQRTVSSGLNALVSAVCESVRIDEEEALAFLEDNDITKIASAYPDVKYILDSIITSIGRIFEFYNSRSQEHPITGVKYIGDATLVNGIGDMLSSGLGFEAEEIKFLRNVDVRGRVITQESATNFLANIGALFAPMHLKYEAKSEAEKEKEDAKLPWGLVIISAVLSIALVAGTFTFYYLTKLKRDRLSAQLASIEDILTLEEQLNEATAKITAAQSLYDSTVGAGDTIPTFIEDMEKIMPKGMAIDTLNIADSMVTINAAGQGKEGVARFIQEIKQLKYVQNVKVDYVSETKETLDPYDTFTMTFTLTKIPEETEETIEVVEGEEAPTETMEDSEAGGEE